MERTIRHRTFTVLLASAFLLCCTRPLLGADSGRVTIIDARHYSNVFAEMRNYRIFLPPGYSGNPDKRYPVIYFFHGWSQRYFGTSTPYSEYDKGDENGGDNIENFVSRHDVLVVKVDGYNRSPDENYYVRPWNVSPVETYRQFPLYFPELVKHIDSQYRTIADREHRGISGLSMGGFMTFWIGGKYPHLLSAAGNFCGSPEFMVGPKDFPVEYRHLDMYDNYAGMKLRLNYGDKDFIRGYHEDLNRVWPQVIDNYEYGVYDAAHSTCGMGEMFSFIMKTFEAPPARPSRWDHIDVYPEFSVWNYSVTTDRTSGGFTVLEDVDARGFRCSVREFLPDGALLPAVNVSVTTAAIYEKDQWYTINDVDLQSSRATRRNIRSDHEGRLTIDISGSLHEVGINRKTDRPNLSLVAADLQAVRWATHGEEVLLTINVLNKGLSTGKNIRATLSPTRPSAEVTRGEVSFGDIAPNEIKAGNTAIAFRISDDKVEIAKFRLTLRDDRSNDWVAFFEIPIRKAVPELKDFVIADGKVFTVAKAGTDTETILLGKGNGDGVANPGESVVILVREQDKLWRAALTGSDEYVNPFGVNVRGSDNWSSMDHVGASAKYDVPLIASTCPENHTVVFLAEYWLPDAPLHIIRQGTVSIQVKGEDTTPPAIGRIQVTGDNVLQVKIHDGARIARVKARLVAENDVTKFLEIPLSDDGANGDRVANDLLFSQKISDQGFGIFRVIIEAEDALGNRTVHEAEDHFVVH